MTLTKWIKRNPLEAGLFTVTALLVLLHSGDILALLSQNRALRAQAAKGQQQTAELQIAQDKAKEAAEIARQRYEQGCTLVVASNDPKSLTSLTIGLPVLDGVRQTPLAPGTVVCDEKGGTALIRDSQELPVGTPWTCTVLLGKTTQSFGDHCPVAAEYAYTGDRAIVEAAIKHANAGHLKRLNSRI